MKLVEPPEAKNKEPSEEIVENRVNDTPLPQLNFPPLTPQSPFDDVIVKLEADPDNVNVARVCVDHVPRDKRPPSLVPERIALIVALAGNDPEVPVGEGEVVVGVLEPDLGGYLIPDDGHEPDSGASMGTNTPSTIDPFKLKYHDIALSVLPLQSKAGMTPEALLKAEVSVERVNVFDVLGMMPALANQT